MPKAPEPAPRPPIDARSGPDERARGARSVPTERPDPEAGLPADRNGDCAVDAATDPAAKLAESLLAAVGLARPIPARPDVTGPALEWARSGAMALTGDADGPPRFASGGLATAAAGTGAALAALAPGAGFEALDAPALLGERAALFGFGRRGRTSCGASARILDTADGALVVNLPRDDDWRLLEAWLETPLADAPTTRDWTRLARAIARRNADPLVERGREIGLAVAFAAAAPDAAARPFRLDHETRRTPPAAHALARPPGRRPRVLDLSTLWAGPLAGGLLAQAGFDVLKLESRTRPDGARAGEPAFFERLHAGKRGGSLDLFAAEERALFVRLLDAADVVLESARPRALLQLGFDARAWVAARPGRIWASITGYGRDHEWIAFGDDAAVAAGLAYDPTTASLAGSPRFCADAVADPLTGLYAAVAIAGLDRAGRGGLLSLALAEVAAHAAGAGEGAALALPLALRSGGWAVQDGGNWHAVALPRARPVPASTATVAETGGSTGAPPLRALDAALVDDWTRPC